MDPNIFKFEDKPTVADPVFEYPDSLQSSGEPIVIDNGSYKCRVGWASDQKPRLTFKNIIAKSRTKKQDTVETQIANDITNIEVVRWQLKSQFDRNVITQYDAQEQLLDYTFSHLGIASSGCVEHPIVLTEAVCNPNYCRQKMSELLFECYHVPSVAYGVDALFSLYNNHPYADLADALIVSCGYHTTHILPVLSGRLQAMKCRRVNLGGSHMEFYLQRLLQLKYPGHFAAVTLGRAEDIVASHCHVSDDYPLELSKWIGEDYYCDNVHKFQLPFTAALPPVVNTEQQKERRDQQVRRLKDLNAKKREEKLAADQEKLSQLLSIQEMLEDEDEETFYRALQELDMKSADELQDAINQVNNSIHNIRYKILTAAAESRSEQAYDLLDVPDDQLTSDQREQKKRQRIIKSNAEALAKKPRPDKRMSGSPPLGSSDAMIVWVKKIRKQKQEVMDARSDRRRRKAEMTKRRTQASQQRMKIITELARGTKKKKDDTFGQNDDDWNVYKEINKDAGESDSEAEQEKLDELEIMLREHDPNFKDPNLTPTTPLDPAEYYRLHVGVEQIRIPELLFQPSMLGHEQAGVAETMQFVLAKFTPEEQTRLCQYIYMTGGAASFPGLQQRTENELLCMRPFQSTFSVHTANDPVLDAWYGARRWALSPALERYSVTKEDYEEKGGSYLREHCVTNLNVSNPP